MAILLVIVHVIVCIALIMIVLLQTGKGSDMGAALGGGSSQTLFGSTGASTFLSKATTIAAVVFMVTSFWLAYISSQRQGGSVVENQKTPVEQTPPAATDTSAGKESEAPLPAQPVQAEKKTQNK